MFIGIDIAAKSFDVVERQGGKTSKAKQFEQTPISYERLIKRLNKLKPTLIVMEATGIYHLDLAVTLTHAGLPGAVINPASFRRFSELMLTQSKTDGIDASLLAEYGERMTPRLWTAPSEASLSLKDIGRQINRLTNDRAKAKNRLHALTSKSMTAKMLIEDEEDGIAMLSRRINRLTKAARELINSDSNLELHYKNMCQAKGIAETSAIAILGEFVVLPKDIKAKQVSRYAGLDIKQVQSGTSVNKPSRISKAGNTYLRSALFMPALCAGNTDQNAKAFKDALVGRGKKKIQANVAIMRKYLTGLWAVYQNGEPFDSAKLFNIESYKA